MDESAQVGVCIGKKYTQFSAENNTPPGIVFFSCRVFLAPELYSPYVSELSPVYKRTLKFRDKKA